MRHFKSKKAFIYIGNITADAYKHILNIDNKQISRKLSLISFAHIYITTNTLSCQIEIYLEN